MLNLKTLHVTLFAAMLIVDSVALADVPSFGYETTIHGYYLASGRGVAVDDDGNAYVIAQAIGDQQQNNVLILKLDVDGNQVWANYIEGEGHDYAADILFNGDGEIYVTGWTDSDDFPITANAMDNSLTGFREAFLLKLATVDGSMTYSTFLGGDYTDEGRGIAINSAGEILLVGLTKSTDFPTVNAYQSEPNAPLYVYSDVFITRLNPAGDSIRYSTYFGGYSDDVAVSVAADNDNGIVIAGETDATDFPLVNPVASSPADLFVAKFSEDGGTLLFSTYFGGEDWDRMGAMTLDADGYVYIAGSTRSIDFPTTVGVYQEDFVGDILGCEVPFGADYNCEDIYLSKMATDGSGLVFSTFLGGSTVDECRDVTVDTEGRAYVVGYTFSGNFPPTGIDFSAAIILSRFSSDGSQLDYSVTVNSGSANAGHGVCIDEAGDIYFTGATEVPAVVYVAKLVSGDTGNQAPNTPSTPTGIANGEAGVVYDFSTGASDPDDDPVYYLFDWDDSSTVEWLGPYSSGQVVSASHSWEAGTYGIRVKSRDTSGLEGGWSPFLSVEIWNMVRGDADGDSSVDISDAVFLIDYIFSGGPAPDPQAAGDTDCDETVTIADVVNIVNFIFAGGPEPGDPDGDGVPDC